MEINFGFVTTESTTEMRKRADDAGASFVIAKPLTFNCSKTPSRAKSNWIERRFRVGQLLGSAESALLSALKMLLGGREGWRYAART